MEMENEVGFGVSNAPDIEAGAEAQPDSSTEIESWVLSLLAVCFSSAFVLAISSLDGHSLGVQMLSIAVFLCFFSLLLAEAVKAKSLIVSQILHGFAIFSAISAFLMAISIPLPLGLQIFCSLVYLICSSVVIYVRISHVSVKT